MKLNLKHLLIAFAILWKHAFIYTNNMPSLLEQEIIKKTHETRSFTKGVFNFPTLVNMNSFKVCIICAEGNTLLALTQKKLSNSLKQNVIYKRFNAPITAITKISNNKIAVSTKDGISMLFINYNTQEDNIFASPKRFIELKNNSISSMVARNQERLFTASSNGLIQCWDLTTGEERVDYRSTTSLVLTNIIKLSDTRFATGDTNGNVYMFKLTESLSETGLKNMILLASKVTEQVSALGKGIESKKFNYGDAPITGLANVSNSISSVLAISLGKTIFYQPLTQSWLDLEQTKRDFISTQQAISSLAAIPNTPLIAAGLVDGSIELFNYHDKELPTKSSTLSTDENLAIRSLAITQEHILIATTSSGIYIWPLLPFTHEITQTTRLFLSEFNQATSVKELEKLLTLDQFKKLTPSLQKYCYYLYQKAMYENLQEKALLESVSQEEKLSNNLSAQIANIKEDLANLIQKKGLLLDEFATLSELKKHRNDLEKIASQEQLSYVDEKQSEGMLDKLFNLLKNIRSTYTKTTLEKQKNIQERITALEKLEQEIVLVQQLLRNVEYSIAINDAALLAIKKILEKPTGQPVTSSNEKSQLSADEFFAKTGLQKFLDIDAQILNAIHNALIKEPTFKDIITKLKSDLLNFAKIHPTNLSELFEDNIQAAQEMGLTEIATKIATITKNFNTMVRILDVLYSLNDSQDSIDSITSNIDKITQVSNLIGELENNPIQEFTPITYALINTYNTLANKIEETSNALRNSTKEKNIEPAASTQNLLQEIRKGTLLKKVTPKASPSSQEKKPSIVEQLEKKFAKTYNNGSDDSSDYSEEDE